MAIFHSLLVAAGLVILLEYTFSNKPGPVETAGLFTIAGMEVSFFFGCIYE